MGNTPDDLYSQLITHIFFAHFTEKTNEFSFAREEIIEAARALNLARPRNIGDVIYTFRFRRPLPESIQRTALTGHEWIIRGGGPGVYVFSMVKRFDIIPNKNLVDIKILDSTPAIINKYALSDEQALLAKVRYNRIIDIFTSITCYSLQNHLRTNVRHLGQVETDEIYIGVDKNGVQYVLPVQAKGGRDRIGRTQIEQDAALCRDKFPQLICRPIATQFIRQNLIALFEFVIHKDEIRIVSEKHYQLVEENELSDEDLQQYRMYNSS